MKQQIIEIVKPIFEGKEKRCPKCGHKGLILEDFGLRFMMGKQQAQSWCFGCRKADAREKRKGLKPGDKVEVSGLGKPLDGTRSVGTVSKIAVSPPPENAVLPADTEELRKLYQEHYPNDNHKRGPKIMRERLGKKLGKTK